MDRVAARLGSRFAPADSVEALGGLGPAGVTAVWVERPNDPMHVVLVVRGADGGGLVLVETQDVDERSFVEFDLTDEGLERLPQALLGPVRLLVDDQGRLLQRDLSKPASVAVRGEHERVDGGSGLVSALLDSAATASPGMPSRRRGAASVQGTSAQGAGAQTTSTQAAVNEPPPPYRWNAQLKKQIEEHLSAYSQHLRIQFRFSDLAKLERLPREQFQLVIEVIERDPVFAVGFARNSEAIPVMVDKWPHVFHDLVSQVTAVDLSHIDLSFLADSERGSR